MKLNPRIEEAKELAASGIKNQNLEALDFLAEALIFAGRSEDSISMFLGQMLYHSLYTLRGYEKVIWDPKELELSTAAILQSLAVAFTAYEQDDLPEVCRALNGLIKSCYATWHRSSSLPIRPKQTRD